MTLEAFKSSLLAPAPPPGLSTALEALWYDGKNEWHRAHNLAQDLSSEDGSWIHAYLHRKEGDHSNAAYWYRRAGRPVPRTTPEREWEQLATELLQRS